MRKKFHVKKGDTVLVLSGESKGKRGTVLKVITDKDRAVVEGVNIITKHIKPTAGRPQGEKIQTEGTIHISNLMLIEPKTQNPTRIGRMRNAVGKLVRVSKKTGEEIK